MRTGLRRLERLTLRVEKPVNKLVGSARLNPFYHTGTISVFLFAVIFGTGIYITMWFQYGFDESYAAVAWLERNGVGRLMRAVHRYASVAFVVTSLLHGWRTFVQDRFRGARWLAWVSGIWMVAMLWVIGVTGYWLIWDERAQALNEVLIRALRGSELGLDFLLDNLLTPAAGSGWPFLLLLFLIHLVLSLVLGWVLWYHMKRLTHRRWFPPRFWMTIVGGAIVVLSIVWPVGMLPAFDASRIPGSFPLDPFYLFLFPLGLNLPPVLVWGGFLVIGILLSLLPWIKREPAPPEIVVDEDRCTGCMLCAVDCPYGALEMVPRDDGEYRQIAVVVPNRCVSCGICIGSCSDDALSLGEVPIDDLTLTVVEKARSDSARIVIACDRHIKLGKPDPNDPEVHVIGVECIGMAHPHLAQKALDAGASDVQFIGCPPSDCANMRGNTWTQSRLDRTRVPRLKKRYLDAPIETDWVSPIDIASATANPGEHSIVDPADHPGWRRMIPLGILVAAVSVVSILLTNISFSPGFPDTAVISIAMKHQPGAVLDGNEGEPAIDEAADTTRLVVRVGGETVLDSKYPATSIDGGRFSEALERIEMPPGVQPLEILLFDRIDAGHATVLFDDTVAVPPGGVLNLPFTDSVTESRAERGEALYYETTLGQNTGCRVCHSLKPDQVVVGPTFDGIGTRAESTVPGLTAEEYLYESIVDPDAYVVDGFEPGVMLPNFSDLLTEEQIGDLVAFLLTLE
ncbi:MAG: hydrogenase iron-sulfur subunit [Actinomycetota bacterium]